MEVELSVPSDLTISFQITTQKLMLTMNALLMAQAYY